MSRHFRADYLAEAGHHDPKTTLLVILRLSPGVFRSAFLRTSISGVLFLTDLWVTLIDGQHDLTKVGIGLHITVGLCNLFQRK